jgi:hypothetical protein
MNAAHGAVRGSASHYRKHRAARSGFYVSGRTKHLNAVPLRDDSRLGAVARERSLLANYLSLRFDPRTDPFGPAESDKPSTSVLVWMDVASSVSKHREYVYPQLALPVAERHGEIPRVSAGLHERRRSHPLELLDRQYVAAEAESPETPAPEESQSLRTVFRRGLVVAISLLAASAAVLPFVPELAVFGIGAIFLVLGGTVLADNVTSRQPLLDPRLGTLFIVVALGTFAVAIIGATT